MLRTLGLYESLPDWWYTINLYGVPSALFGFWTIKNFKWFFIDCRKSVFRKIFCLWFFKQFYFSLRQISSRIKNTHLLGWIGWKWHNWTSKKNFISIILHSQRDVLNFSTNRERLSQPTMKIGTDSLGCELYFRSKGHIISFHLSGSSLYYKTLNLLKNLWKMYQD